MEKIKKTGQGTSKRTRSTGKKRQWLIQGTLETINVSPVFQGSPPSMPTPFKVVGKTSPHQEGHTSTNSRE